MLRRVRHKTVRDPLEFYAQASRAHFLLSSSCPIIRLFAATGYISPTGARTLCFSALVAPTWKGKAAWKEHLSFSMVTQRSPDYIADKKKAKNYETVSDIHHFLDYFQWRTTEYHLVRHPLYVRWRKIVEFKRLLIRKKLSRLSGIPALRWDNGSRLVTASRSVAIINACTARYRANNHAGNTFC